MSSPIAQSRNRLRNHSVSPPTSPCLKLCKLRIARGQAQQNSTRTLPSVSAGLNQFSGLRDSMDNLRVRSLSPERNPPGIIRRPDWQLHRRPTPPLDEPFARLRESMNNLRTRSPPPELLTPPPERNAIPTLQQSMENLTIIATPPPGLITPEEHRTCETEIGD